MAFAVRSLRPAQRRLMGPSAWFSTTSTPVNVADIKLSKPEGGGRREVNWTVPDGMEDSLIPETLKRMAEDEEFQITARQLKEMGAVRMSREERQRRRRALDNLGVPSFREFLQQQEVPLPRQAITVFQMNIGLYCNQACNHCHVESSPQRTEAMSADVVDHCLKLVRESPSVMTVDLTGGAPELTPQFRRIVEGVSAINRETGRSIEVIDRCNLTVLLEPGQEDLAHFLAEHRVRVVASLPCYSRDNVDTQRGSGVFERSIEGLRRLNAVGYGAEGSGLFLDLVYNPLGAFLPPPQAALQDKYKEELSKDFGIAFNGLFTITNMPIKRFADFLYKRGELEGYMKLLVDNFNPTAAEGVMCRSHLSVGWDGKVYDCDFNQQIGMHMPALKGAWAPNGLDWQPAAGAPEAPSVFDIADLGALEGVPIALGGHCFGCTAGAGSSCQGATA